MSWHYNEFTAKSVIRKLIDLLDESNYICIWTTDERDFMITNEDRVIIGDGAMLIESKNKNGTYINLINTDYITSIDLLPSVKKD